MNTKEKIEVMQAYIDHKPIEFKSNTCNNDYWKVITCALWDWCACEYRIKKEISLEDRVKAEYGDFDVVMLEWEEGEFLTLKTGNVIKDNCHIYAQSMKGFAGYIYDFDKQGLDRDFEPIWPQNQVKAIQPIAAIFSRGEG